jgi:hypothetical protein
MALKLTQLAAKPQLIKIELDDEEIRREYNDSLEFWIYDRQPIEEFVKMATIKSNDFGEMVTAVNKLVLDEEGNQVIQEGYALPSSILIKVINCIVDIGFTTD